MTELSALEIELKKRFYEGLSEETPMQYMPLADDETLHELKASIRRLCTLKEFATLCIWKKPKKRRDASCKTVENWLNHGIPADRYETIADAAWEAFCKKAQDDYETDTGHSTTLEISMAEDKEDPEARKLGVSPIVVLVGETKRRLDNPLKVEAICAPYLEYDRICTCLMSLRCTLPYHEAGKLPEPVRDPIMTAAYNALDHEGRIELLGIAGVLLRGHARDDWPFDRDALASLISKAVEGDGRLGYESIRDNEAARAIMQAHR